MAKVTPRSKDDTPTEAVVRQQQNSTTLRSAEGNEFVIRKLSPIQKMKLFAVLGPELTNNSHYLGYAVIAVCIMSINGEPLPFPSSRRDLEALIGRISEAEFELVGEAVARLNNMDAGDSKQALDLAKN